ncbi:hypothetical protein Tcan_12768 [Toxocara canis]|uniref:Uncharacterized protein n=1 Tax=Toxocara canis TaxID=6265 RepID=A0A0B2VEC8_TOXCA|nr:hypothetical protein Tcan_12768 [Toxocara canis]
MDIATFGYENDNDDNCFRFAVYVALCANAENFRSRFMLCEMFEYFAKCFIRSNSAVACKECNGSCICHPSFINALIHSKLFADKVYKLLYGNWHFLLTYNPFIYDVTIPSARKRLTMAEELVKGSFRYFIASAKISPN